MPRKGLHFAPAVPSVAIKFIYLEPNAVGIVPFAAAPTGEFVHIDAGYFSCTWLPRSNRASPRAVDGAGSGLRARTRTRVRRSARSVVWV